MYLPIKNSFKIRIKPKVATAKTDICLTSESRKVSVFICPSFLWLIALVKSIIGQAISLHRSR